MTNQASNKVFNFYLTQSPYTDFGAFLPMLRNIPNDIAGICQSARNVIEHYNGINSHKIKKIRLLDIDLRHNKSILARMQKQGYDDVSQGVEFNDRVIGTCRTQSVFTCGLLRSKGIPARLRYKYCTYFVDDFNHEQVIVEYWCAKKMKWLLADPAMNYAVLDAKGIKIDFDLCEVPNSKAMSIAEAWLLCRKNLADPSVFGAFNKATRHNGFAHIRRKLYQDLACLNNIEVVEWDRWGIFLENDQFSRDEALFCDYLADLMNQAQLQDEALYENIPGLNKNVIPVEGISVSPVNDSYKVVYERSTNQRSLKCVPN